MHGETTGTIFRHDKGKQAGRISTRSVTKHREPLPPGKGELSK